ncbi:MAG: PTS sugar transporter subunit IIA [Spirochaetaceae bacterium]|nr:PTS sugar transporter subunit IIA [Spirochaetaceae bacterium]|tara:strand:+ start:69639 stop:69899 length:261 start_codon:yes stop_codon:yes gene_type:complete
METVEVVIELQEGLHARPASIFVREAAKYKSEVFLTANGVTVNGKSIMGILMLALSPGTRVQLEIRGDDEKEAIARLPGLLNGEES